MSVHLWLALGVVRTTVVVVAAQRRSHGLRQRGVVPAVKVAAHCAAVAWWRSQAAQHEVAAARHYGQRRRTGWPHAYTVVSRRLHLCTARLLQS